MAREKRQALTVYLLRDSVSSLDQAIKDDAPTVPVSPSLPFPALLATNVRKSDKTKWVDFASKFAAQPMQAPTAQSCALLVVKTPKRFFALTFGNCSSIFNEHVVEYGFGLKLVLNVVKETSLKSMDAHTFDTLTRHTVAQINRGAELESFGLDAQRDILRAVAGEPTDQAKYGKRIVGRDPVILSTTTSPDKLVDFLDSLLVDYEKTIYRDKGFRFIDNVKLVKSKDTISKLNDKVIKKLLEGDDESLYVTPPKPIDWEKVGGFSYAHTTKRTDIYDDLDNEHLFKFLKEQGFKAEDVDSFAIRAHHHEDDSVAERWPLMKCLSAEVTEDGTTYALSLSRWFEIEPNFEEEIEKRLDRIPDFTAFTFPGSTVKEKEEDYNKRISGTIASGITLALLDKKLVNRIEICDLYSSQYHFIHVKRKTRSATLSHLFAQGLVGARLMQGDKVFRAKVIATLSPPHQALPKLTTFDPNAHTVVFAIITSSTAALRKALPFFSKVNLASQADLIEAMGYRVELAKIPATGAARKAKRKSSPTKARAKPKPPPKPKKPRTVPKKVA